MPALFRGTGAVANTASGTTVSPLCPTNGTTTGCNSGDLLVAVVALGTTTTQTFTAPSGWTQQLYVHTNLPALAIFTKVAVLADRGAIAAFSWTPTTTGASAVIASYAGVDSTILDTPIGTSANGTTSTTVNLGSNGYVSSMGGVGIAMASASTTTWSTMPSGYTQRSSNTSRSPQVLIADKTDGAVGATVEAGTFPTLNATALVTATSNGAYFTARPAVGPVPRDSNVQDNGTSPPTVSWEPGDIIIVGLFMPLNNVTITPPNSNWLLIGTQNDGTRVQQMGVYMARMSPGDTPFTDTWGMGTAPSWSWHVSAWSGVTDVPQTFSTSNAASTTMTFYGSFTPSIAPATLAFLGWGKSATGYTVNKGQTQMALGAATGSWESISSVTPRNTTDGQWTQGSSVSYATCTILLYGLIPDVKLVQQFATGTSVAITKPTGTVTVADGDLMVLVGTATGAGGQTNTISLSTGNTPWGLVAKEVSVNTRQLYVYSKIATSEGSTITTVTASTSTQWTLIVISGNAIVESCLFGPPGASTATPAPPSGNYGPSPNPLIVECLATSGDVSVLPASLVMLNDGHLPETSTKTIAVGIQGACKTPASVTDPATWTLSAATTSYDSVYLSITNPNGRNPLIIRQAVNRAGTF